VVKICARISKTPCINLKILLSIDLKNCHAKDVGNEILIYKTVSFGYFPSANDRIENATHNTLPKKLVILISICNIIWQCIVGCIFNSVGLIITCIELFMEILI
jgi:hypothetical protein